ncbi:MAG: ABC transporter permease subunit [Armatimonadetes bacterium]|nr:ABC transporter permease subunit [Armatimonadota bacterium]NIM23005.1 ABC transporter permease subunit [Armatimonadota bacterium]NIM66876.1 ABC transporter permease subunit [Armatimonadota bacterium]NIM75416.1 ABC transporter permease subunit [Armatimonadota bacterium]NIN05063.1 ABC transporter permease subunit [Armatimonadota bacterium]
MVIPFLWMISTSLKRPREIYVWPPTLLPQEIFWSNYLKSWSAAPFGRFYLNSLFVALSVTGGQLITCTFAAYAFARLNFRGRDTIFLIFLATLMIPAQVAIIGLFQIINWIGWVDSYYALIVPGVASAFGTFLLRQFFLTLPTELEDAARIDGCGRLGIIRHVIVPLSVPALATLGIFTFMGVWNDFMWPLVVMNSQEHFTVQLGLAIFRDARSTEWNLLMAGTVTATLPILIVFFFAQRYFIRGIALTGLKG